MFAQVGRWLGPRSPLGSPAAGVLCGLLYGMSLFLLMPWLFKFFGWYFDWVRAL